MAYKPIDAAQPVGEQSTPTPGRASLDPPQVCDRIGGLAALPAAAE